MGFEGYASLIDVPLLDVTPFDRAKKLGAAPLAQAEISQFKSRWPRGAFEPVAAAPVNWPQSGLTFSAFNLPVFRS